MPRPVYGLLSAQYPVSIQATITVSKGILFCSKVKLKEPRRQKLEWQNSWQGQEYARLYSDLLQAGAREPLIALDAQHSVVKFMRPR